MKILNIKSVFVARPKAMGFVIRGDGIDLKVNDMLLGERMKMVEIRWSLG